MTPDAIIEEIRRFKEAMWISFAIFTLLAAIICLNTRLPDAIGVVALIVSLGFLIAGIRRRLSQFLTRVMDEANHPS